MSSLLVFGSINLDVSMQAARLPLLGETLMGTGVQLSPGGKGGNQAHAARLFGAQVKLVGAVGQDQFAECALACLDRCGVDLSGVQHLVAAHTGTAVITVTVAGENAIIVAPGTNDLIRADWVGEADLLTCATLLLQMEVPVVESMSLARRVKQAGGRVILNLAPVRDLHLVEPDCIDWLIVNQSELAELCEYLGLKSTAIADQAGIVHAAWGCAVVVTLGEAGSMACLPSGDKVEFSPMAVVVKDTTGAGDTFCGVLAASLALGDDSMTSLRNAGVAASLACEKWGAQTAQPSREQLRSSCLNASDQEVDGHIHRQHLAAASI